MEQVIWVEVLTDQKSVVARYRCTGPRVTIGRAYDNDVVMDDPYVAAHHLVVEFATDGSLNATDLKTTNGSYLEGHTERQTQFPCTGDSVLRLGRTHLRLRTASFAVAAERPTTPASTSWWSPTYILLPLAICILSILTQWSVSTTPFKAFHYIMGVVGVGSFVLTWTVFWSFLSRTFSGRANFLGHLKIAMIFFLGLNLLVKIHSIITFALSSTFLVHLGLILGLLYIGLISYLHLRAMGAAHLKWKAAGVTAFTLTILTLMLFNTYSEPKILSPYDYITELQPPAFRFLPAQKEDDFWKSVSDLQAKLDAARKEEAPADVKKEDLQKRWF